MKAPKTILSGLAVIFILIQLIPSGIPEIEPETPENIMYSDSVPEQVLEQLRLSCFDCHSDQTDLPWYSKVAPVSWWLAGHINEGKEHLNFSRWALYNKREKIRHIENIIEETRSGSMPLKSYLLIHNDAKLNENEISAIKDWGEGATEKLFE